MKIFYSLLFVACILFSSTELNAAHIVGGDVTYQCLGLDTLANGDENIRLQLNFNMYRDSQSGGAQFDNPARIGIYRYDASGYQYVTQRTPMITTQSDVDLDTDNPCVIYPPNVGVQRAYYGFEIELPVLKGADEGYAFVYQRCCRNSSITNLVSPADTGAAFSVEITSLAMSICNSSPRFRNFPPVVICSDVRLEFDHSASDFEGHQVFYEFCAPITAGGTDGATTPGNTDDCTGVTPDPFMCPPPYDEVTFKLPDFTSTNPLAGDPVVTIDPVTGMISGVPNINGQYVVGVCAREIFNGEIMSVIRRDFQFNVTRCDIAVTAQILPQGDAMVEGIEQIVDGVMVDVPTITSCGKEDIEFEHVGPSEDIETYLWIADFKNGNIGTADTKSTTFTFPGPGDYSVLLVTNESLECEARDSFPVRIFPDLYPDFTFDYDTCVADAVVFEDFSTLEWTNQTIQNWQWDFDGFGTSNLENPNFNFNEPGSHAVNLTITDQNNCSSDVTKIVDYYPAPPILIVQINTFTGCAPASIFFNNLSTPIDSTYDVFWEFGDGNTSTEISPTHLYEEVGKYDVSLKVTSPIGCEIDTFSSELITVVEKPMADFDFSPEEPSVFNPTVNFIDLSQDAVSWEWDFMESFSVEQNPTYTFRDTGVYNVNLVVRHLSGCTDTMTRVIDIRPIVTFHMPNAFTPNGDASNDILIGNGFFEDMSDFNFTIWNRWGEKVFESNDPYKGWDGTKNNNGQNSPMGVYVYSITYVDPRGKNQSLRGQATLIR